MNSGVVQVAGFMLRNLERTEHQVTSPQDSLCKVHDGTAPDEMPIEAAGRSGYFPFRGIVIGSVLGLGIWLLIWLLA